MLISYCGATSAIFLPERELFRTMKTFMSSVALTRQKEKARWKERDGTKTNSIHRLRVNLRMSSREEDYYGFSTRC